MSRSAIHSSSVFIVDREHRLQKKQVGKDFAQSEFVAIKSGLSGGEMVVVSDPFPAIIDMKVSPVPDPPQPVISDSIPDLVYDFSDSQIPTADYWN